MTDTWSPDELERIGSATELEIAVRRADGTGRRWVPIWAVCVGERVYVRTVGSHSHSHSRAWRRSGAH